MLNRIIRFSLENRLFVVAGAALLLVYGTLVVLKLPVDVFPDLNRPTVTIMTEAPGLAPEEVETLVTLPIEVAMNGAPGVMRVRSSSGIGLSIAFVEFDWGTDIYRDRQLVSERLQIARERLPEGIAPVMGPVSSIMGEIMLIGMGSRTGKTSPMEIRTLADWVVRQRLLTIPGIAQVIPIGGEVKQYQILASHQKLLQVGVSLEEVGKAAAGANLNTTGGFLESHSQEYLVRNLGRTASLEDLGNAVVVYQNGVPVLLRHVATVGYGARIKRGDASVDGRPAVILSVQKQPGANTVTLTRQVERALDEIQKTLPPDVRIDKELFKQASFIQAAISNVEEALRDGAILVAIVLFLFLLNFRTTAITLTAIPLSFVIAGLVFRAFGLSVNTMTLGGLAVAIGELVDDAIVDVENVFRRLKENRHLAVDSEQWTVDSRQGDCSPLTVHRSLLEKPDHPLKVIYRASSEIRNSIVYATVIVILVFIPLFSLSGIEGRLFVPLGVAYIVSILASLLVSLTVTPALCSYLLPRARMMEKEEDAFLVRWLKALDRRQLELTLSHPFPVMALAALLVLGAGALVPFMGQEFLPEFNEGTVTVNVLSPPGTSLSESNRIGTIAERLLLTVPEVASTGRRTGRAELDEHAEGVHYSEMEVTLNPHGPAKSAAPGNKNGFWKDLGIFTGKPSERSRAEILGEVRAKLSQIPGVVLNIGQPISHRLDHLLSGIRAQVAVKIFGDDLDTLRAKSGEVEAAMREVPGVADLQVEKQVLIPQVHVAIQREEGARYGVRVGDLAELLETAFNGRVVSQVLDGQRTFDILVRYDQASRGDLEAIRSALVDVNGGASGRKVPGSLLSDGKAGGEEGLPNGPLKLPLSQVARVEEAWGPNVVQRENVQRRIVVQCNTAGRDLGSVIRDIQQAIARRVSLPPGYFITYGGQFESQQEATRRIAFLSLASLAGMFLVLYAHFRSASIVLQVLINVPLSLVGSVAAIYLTGGTLSVASLVGFITLIGIASRNTIMMISHYLHLVRYEGEGFTREMVIRGSLERLRPVLMTALVAGLALIPLVLAKGEPGKEILYPVATVILGGLMSSTLLNMAVTPAIFYRFGRPAVEKLLHPEEVILWEEGERGPL